MSLTIASYYTTGIKITLSTDNPVDISSTGTIVAAGSYALFDDVSVATISNDGTVRSTGTSGFGIELTGSGTVNNFGIIESQYIGISAGNGIYVANGSTAETGGMIDGGNYGVRISGGTVSNFGSIIATGSKGIAVDVTGDGRGNVVDNGSSEVTGGLLSGVDFGIFIGAGSGSVTNFGSIISTAPGEAAVAILNNALVINGSGSMAAGLIKGSTGVGIGGDGTIINDGKIIGTAAGISAGGGGYITNGSNGAADGMIAGVNYGVKIGTGTVSNFGNITATDSNGIAVRIGGNHGTGGGSEAVSNFGSIIAMGSIGIAVYISGQDGNEVVNGSSVAYGGLISGTECGVLISAGNGSVTNFGRISGSGTNGTGIVIESTGAVTNAGTITGGGGVAIAFGSRNAHLIIDPGAVFQGVVEAQNGGGLMELAGNATEGTVAGLGTSFTGFATIDFDAGATWRVEGDTSGLANGEAINGFAAGDTIFLDGFTAASHSYSDDGLVLGDGESFVTIDIAGDFSTNSFLVTDTAEGTEIAICYLRGTRIRTQRGDIAIEALNIGDIVTTRYGGQQAVKWIGYQRFARRFLERNAELMPVRIMAGALGTNSPERDLFVSPGHSILLDGQLVLAKFLLNGVTVRQDFAEDVIHYFNIELERHDCVLAEGCWAESYADCPGLRAKFHNAADFHLLHPEFVTPPELALCAPRPLHGPMLERVLRGVCARAANGAEVGPLQGWVDRIEDTEVIHGWAWDEQNPHLPVLLEVLVDGKVIDEMLAREYRGDVAEAGIGNGACGFVMDTPIDVRKDFCERLRIRRKSDGRELRFGHALQEHFARRAA